MMNEFNEHFSERFEERFYIGSKVSDHRKTFNTDGVATT